MSRFFGLTRHSFAILFVLLQIVLISWYLMNQFQFGSLSSDILRGSAVPTQTESVIIFTQSQNSGTDLTDPDLRPFFDRIFARLISYRNGSYSADLALNYGLIRHEKGLQVWRIQLRQNLRFHNGDPITFEDIIASFTRAGMTDFDISMIRNYNADERSFEIFTDRPPLSLLSSVYILPADWTELDSLIASGPFTPVRRESKTQGVTEYGLVPNPHYAHDVPAVSVNVSILSSVYRSLARTTQSLIGTDTALTAYNLPYELAQVLRPYCILDESYDKRPYFLMRNVSSVPTIDYRVVESAIVKNREKLAEMYPGSRILTGFASPGIEGYDESLSVSYLQENSLPSPRTLQLATTLVDVPLAAQIAYALNEAGFEVELRPMIPADLLQNMDANESDLYLYRHDYTLEPSLLSLYREFASTGGRFNSGFNSFLVETTLDSITTENVSESLRSVSNAVKYEIGIPLFDTANFNAECG